MAQALFRAADIPRRLMPAAIALGTSTFTMSALPGTPAIQNAIPMPFFGTTPFAAPGLGIIASAIMLGFGLWWLAAPKPRRARAGEGFGGAPTAAEDAAADDPLVRERATTAARVRPGRDPPRPAQPQRPADRAGACCRWSSSSLVNLLMSLRRAAAARRGFLAEPRWGGTSLAAVGGVWSVVVALAAAIVVLVVAQPARACRRCARRMDAGANASVLPVLSVASLVGFGAVVAAHAGLRGGARLGAGDRRRAAGLAGGRHQHPGGADRLGLGRPDHRARRAGRRPTCSSPPSTGIDPALLHRVAVIGAGTLDSLPHNGAVVTLLAVCGCTHRESYFDIVMVGIVGALLALAAVIVLGGLVGSF